jgi:general stress protein YciG
MAQGQNRNSRRGLASADPETRRRVARKGGQASHGGGRRQGS